MSRIKFLACFLLLIAFPCFAEVTLKSEVARLLNEGINYHSNRNYQLAISSFVKALALDLENLQIKSNLSIAHNNYGKYLAERTDGKGAAREFRNALYYNYNNDIARANLEYKLQEIKISPKDSLKRLQQAKQERAEQNFLAAIAELRESNHYQESTDNYLEIGTNFHLLALKSPNDTGFIDKALEAFEQAKNLSPQDPRPLIKLGDINVSIGKINSGIGFYEQAVRLAPNNSEAQSGLINGWLAALRVAPDAPNNYVGLATAYQLKGDFTQAQRSFNRALELDPTNQLAIKGLETLREDQIKTQIGLFLDRAVDLQKQGKIDESLENYIKALNLEPNNADIHYNIGTAFQAKGDLLRAKKAYSKALEINPNQQEALTAIKNLDLEEKTKFANEAFNQAIKLQQEGKAQEAITIYEKIKIDRIDDDVLFYNIGLAYQSLGQKNSALLNFKKAWSLKPDSNYEQKIKNLELNQAEDLLANAVKLQSQGQNQDAINNYQEALKFIPDNAGAWYNLGTAYQARNQNDEALSAYTKAYNLDPKGQTEAIFFAALILEEKHKLMEAMKLYDDYLKNAANGDYASEAKSRKEYIKSFL